MFLRKQLFKVPLWGEIDKVTSDFLISSKYLKAVYLSFHWSNDFRTHGCELATHEFEIETREFEVVTRGFELVTCEFELVTHEVELVPRGFELVGQGFKFLDLNS